jgi:hypothetical protein
MAGGEKTGTVLLPISLVGRDGNQAYYWGDGMQQHQPILSARTIRFQLYKANNKARGFYQHAKRFIRDRLRWCSANIVYLLHEIWNQLWRFPNKPRCWHDFVF